MNTRNQIILVVVIIAVAAAVAVPIAYYQISERVEQQFSFNPTISEEEKELVTLHILVIQKLINS
jgi:uncharacterized protein YneF (UPF0154 family)